MSEEYNSVADRQKASQARVHSDLTQPARERIAQITANPLRLDLPNPFGTGGLPEKYIDQAISRTYEDVGYSEVREYITEIKENHRVKEKFYGEANDNGTPPKISIHRRIVEKGDRDTVLAYLEHLLRLCYASHRMEWDDVVTHTSKLNKAERIRDTIQKINVVMETEGVLWELEQDESQFNFRPVGSEMMAEADEAFSAVASGKKWVRVASPYNDAYDLYKDRTYDRSIPEKLYNSIEELARVICVDLQNWEDNRELNLSNYLELMNEHDLFEPNPIMKAEVKDLANSMEKTFQKAGADRKNRHMEIDREYCTLMLHQVSAYLTYIIRQYEEQYE